MLKLTNGLSSSGSFGVGHSYGMPSFLVVSFPSWKTEAMISLLEAE
jgi:hypothetical protein